jgi:hypothetical protein
MKTLFTTIKDTLTEQVSELEYIDWDYGQFDGASDTLPSVPAVLLDIKNTDFSQAGRDLDMGDILIVLRCGFQLNSQGDSSSQTTASLDFFPVLEKIGQAIDGLKSDETGPLERKSLRRDPLQQERLKRGVVPGIKVFEYLFSINYYEKSSMTDYTTIPKPPLDLK